ncbi:zinc-binding domain-containing protein, partial [Phaeosphaeriaceae sp. PMI808]
RSKPASKSKEETKRQFMFPSLHGAVIHAVFSAMPPPHFRLDDTNLTSTKNYQTSVIGEFSCRNSACHQNGWGSKKVAIVIRQYPENRYNAVVYNQRCKICDNLGSLKLDKPSYVERVAYRLKKWAGVVEAQRELVRGRSEPHESKYCEVCKAGVCR